MPVDVKRIQTVPDPGKNLQEFQRRSAEQHPKLACSASSSSLLEPSEHFKPHGAPILLLAGYPYSSKEMTPMSSNMLSLMESVCCSTALLLDLLHDSKST